MLKLNYFMILEKFKPEAISFLFYFFFPFYLLFIIIIIIFFFLVLLVLEYSSPILFEYFVEFLALEVSEEVSSEDSYEPSGTETGDVLS